MGPRSSQALDRWQIWSVNAYMGPVTLSARPVGAPIAVLHADSEAEMLKEISRYMDHLDEHVRDAREKLDALPAHWTGERAVQERLIEALAALAELTAISSETA